MSEEEFINRIINRISKDYGAVMANELKYIIIRKEREINKQKEVLDKIKETTKEYKYTNIEDYSSIIEFYRKLNKILEEIE